MVSLSNDPGDYGLPFPKFWPGQRDMTERGANLQPGEVLLVESPTGSGKSCLPALVSHFRPGTTVLVASRDLQMQYGTSFEEVEFKIVWGRDHYPCASPEHVAEFKHVYGVEPSRADCPHKKASECKYVWDCEYEQAKRMAMVARAKVLNFHYAFYARWWRPLCHDLFCDEAHKLPTSLSDLVSVEVRGQTKDRYGLPSFPVVRGGSSRALDKARVWLGRCVSILLLYSKAKDARKARRAERLRGNLNYLQQTLAYAEEGDWYVESGNRGFTARPVVPGKYAGRLFPTEARSKVLMSATIGDPSVLAGELGIEDYQFVTYPHIFPKENRPVTFVKNAPGMSRNSGDEDYEEQFRIIKHILREHKGQRGIIHTASWRHAERIAAAISGNERRIILPKGNRLKNIEDFLHSEPGTVAVGPSWREGLNFADDAARFCIVSKIPYQSLSNPVTKLRLRRKGGNRWYQWSASLAVVQGAGRIVRHAEDYGRTWIIDKNWKRCCRYASKWFEWDEETI